MTGCMYRRRTAFRRCGCVGGSARGIRARSCGRIWCTGVAFRPCAFCVQQNSENIFSSGYTCSAWASFKMSSIVDVIPHVHFQVAAFDETAVTHVALVRLEAAVTSSVQIKRALRFERFRASFADERPLTGVYLSRQQDGVCMKNAAPFQNRKKNGPTRTCVVSSDCVGNARSQYLHLWFLSLVFRRLADLFSAVPSIAANWMLACVIASWLFLCSANRISLDQSNSSHMPSLLKVMNICCAHRCARDLLGE